MGRGDPLKGASQGKTVPRGNETAVSLLSYGSFEYRAGRSLLFTYAWTSGFRVGDRYFIAPVTQRSVGQWAWLTRREIAEYDSLVTGRTLRGLVTDWEGFLQSAENGPMKKLRQGTRTGRPAGDAAFVARVEKITGRGLSKGKPGRPRKRPS